MREEPDADWLGCLLRGVDSAAREVEVRTAGGQDRATREVSCRSHGGGKGVYWCLDATANALSLTCGVRIAIHSCHLPTECELSICVPLDSWKDGGTFNDTPSAGVKGHCIERIAG